MCPGTSSRISGLSSDPALPLRFGGAESGSIVGKYQNPVGIPPFIGNSRLNLMDATGLAGQVRSGEVSPKELTEAAIERIEALNGELNAVIHPLFEKALATEPADGPFRGVPFLLKDLACHSAGDPMHEGMGFLKRIGWVEEEDTWLARRFREAGFVFLGKTNTPSSESFRQPSPRPTGRLATRGTPRARQAARVAVPLPRWRRGWCRSPTRTTAAARSGFRPPAAAWSA